MARANDKNDPGAVRVFLAALPPDQRKALQGVRRVVKKSIPGVQERISYGGVIIFSVGKDLVGCGARPEKLSFFTMSPALAKDLRSTITKTHQVSGATIHFTPEAPLPDALVRRILKRRIEERRQSSPENQEVTG